MALAFASSVRRALPVTCNALCRYAGTNLVDTRDVRQKDIDHAIEHNPHAPEYYGGAFRFLPLSLRGLEMDQRTVNILTEPVPNTEIDVLADGELLVSENECKRRLNKAFGEENWNITPVSSSELDCVVETAVVPLVEYALFVNRKFVAQAIGHAQSPLSEVARKSKAYMSPLERRALGEEARLVALSRCCQNLLIGAELSSEAYAKRWRSKFAHEEEDRRATGNVKVWRKVQDLT